MSSALPVGALRPAMLGGRFVILAAVGFCALGFSGCADAPGRPLPGDVPVVPREISDFDTLYGKNCAGCHGPEGKGGAALALADPVYLAIADDDVIRRTADKWHTRNVHAGLCAECGRHADRQTG